MSMSSGKPAGPPSANSVRADRDVIVFDWDGTVVDSIHAITSAIREAALDLGLQVPSDDQARHVIGLGLQDALRHAVPDLPPSRVSEFAGRYRYHFLLAKPVDQPFHGVGALLKALRENDLRLATISKWRVPAGHARSVSFTAPIPRKP